MGLYKVDGLLGGPLQAIGIAQLGRHALHFGSAFGSLDAQLPGVLPTGRYAAATRLARDGDDIRNFKALH